MTLYLLPSSSLPSSLPPSLPLMQVYKAMADVEAGEELFSRYSTVTEEDGEWLSLRDIVMARKMARRMLVQPLTVLLGNILKMTTNNHILL